MFSCDFCAHFHAHSACRCTRLKCVTRTHNACVRTYTRVRTHALFARKWVKKTVRPVFVQPVFVQSFPSNPFSPILLGQVRLGQVRLVQVRIGRNGLVENRLDQNKLYEKQVYHNNALYMVYNNNFNEILFPIQSK